ncbi:hypothetical protein [Hymenobacter sp. APR13]|uniref:hypothetical protein n=1 Tax=Hymenobacter sp. APR13 TaxID=1356852 RepID=UPI0004E04F39|nr:hypothetical protein [Hymenobacter sp. APR13]AII54416.1 hypothetical protein N008_20815 [Hymenobacter sp. APR13]
MKTPSLFFFFATLSILMALSGALMMGYYSGSNDPLARLGSPLCIGGAALLIASAAVFKKQKSNPDNPR